MFALILCHWLIWFIPGVGDRALPISLIALILAVIVMAN